MFVAFFSKIKYSDYDSSGDFPKLIKKIVISRLCYRVLSPIFRNRRDGKFIIICLIWFLKIKVVSPFCDLPSKVQILHYILDYFSG
jgi:hypothetical protein